MADSRYRFWRRHLGAFVLTSIVLLAGTVCFSVRRSYHGEQQVIQMVQRLGGRFGADSVGPEWLQRAAGLDRMERVSIFQRVSIVDIGGTGITDAEVAQLNRLKNLKVLRLHGTAITDAGIKHLRGMTNLEDVVLSDTGVTDAGLTHMSRLTNLRFLFLYRTSVTKNGIEKLKTALPQCVAYHD